MGMHDLFGVVDDPVTEAARMLAQHDLFVVPGSVMRDCLNVLHILVCDSEDAEEATRIWPWLERQEQYTDELRAIIGQAVQSALPEPARQPPALVWRAPDFDSWPPTS